MKGMGRYAITQKAKRLVELIDSADFVLFDKGQRQELDNVRSHVLDSFGFLRLAVLATYRKSPRDNPEPCSVIRYLVEERGCQPSRLVKKAPLVRVLSQFGSASINEDSDQSALVISLSLGMQSVTTYFFTHTKLQLLEEPFRILQHIVVEEEGGSLIYRSPIFTVASYIFHLLNDNLMSWQVCSSLLQTLVSVGYHVGHVSVPVLNCFFRTHLMRLEDNQSRISDVRLSLVQTVVSWLSCNGWLFLQMTYGDLQDCCFSQLAQVYHRHFRSLGVVLPNCNTCRHEAKSTVLPLRDLTVIYLRRIAYARSQGTHFSAMLELLPLPTSLLQYCLGSLDHVSLPCILMDDSR